MSVFSFSQTDEVWGLNNATTKGMVEWWIERAGPRPYLVQIKESYDFGYNHGDLANVADEDKAELRDLVMTMLKTGYERKVRGDERDAAHVRASIYHLWSLINGDLEGTPYHQSPPGLSNI